MKRSEHLLFWREVRETVGGGERDSTSKQNQRKLVFWRGGNLRCKLHESREWLNQAFSGTWSNFFFLISNIYSCIYLAASGLSWSTQIFPCTDSSCGTHAQERQDSGAAAPGFNSSVTCGNLALWPRTEPTSPALQAAFLTTGPPGKFLSNFLAMKLHTESLENPYPIMLWLMAAAQHTQEVFFKVRRLCSTSSLHPTYFNVQMSQNHKTRDSHGYIPQMTSFQNTFHELNGLLTSSLKKKTKKQFRNLTYTLAGITNCLLINTPRK